MAYVRLLLSSDPYAEENPFPREPLRFAFVPNFDSFAHPHPR